MEPRFNRRRLHLRAIWRDAYRKIRPYLTRDDAAFSPEMMIEIVRSEGRVIEIPVSYYRRRGGESKHSSSRWHSVRTGPPHAEPDPKEADEPELVRPEPRLGSGGERERATGWHALPGCGGRRSRHRMRGTRAYLRDG